MSYAISPISSQANQPDYYELGRQFEDYIIHLFNDEYFQLINYRKSKKLTDNTYQIDQAYPDLEIIFRRGKNYRFAVECKWRQRFRDGRIEWANNFQRRMYMDFENRFRIPVFIAIGIGGKPANPEKLFITPLLNICEDCIVYESDLIPYKRKPTNKFFYDTVQLKLF